MTRTSPRPRWPRLALTLLAMASLAAIAPSAVAAQTETPDPGSPAASPAPTGPATPVGSPAIACDPTDPASVEACLAGATPIEPDPSILDPQPVAFDHVTVSADGRTLTVYFWMGVQECNGLHSVDVERTDGGIELTVRTGIPEDAAGRTCIMIAQLYSTVVTLDEPLIVSGTEA